MRVNSRRIGNRASCPLPTAHSARATPRSVLAGLATSRGLQPAALASGVTHDNGPARTPQQNEKPNSAGCWKMRSGAPAMKFDRRLLGVSETRRTLRVGVGCGWVKSPNGADYESPGQRPGNRGDRREPALQGRSNATEASSLGTIGPPFQGLGNFHGTNFPGRCPGLELGRAFGAPLRAGVRWSGWIPRLRFAPRGMTVTALRVAFFDGL
jgi:hypothetical protein